MDSSIRSTLLSIEAYIDESVKFFMEIFENCEFQGYAGDSRTVQEWSAITHSDQEHIVRVMVESCLYRVAMLIDGVSTIKLIPGEESWEVVYTGPATEGKKVSLSYGTLMTDMHQMLSKKL